MALHHKIVKLINSIRPEAEDMELSEDSDGSREDSDEDSDKWSDCTSSSQ